MKKSIVFLIPSLRCGGAERAAAVLSECWVKQGHSVTLVTFNSPQEKPFYLIYPLVKVIGIGMDSVRGTLRQRLMKNFIRVRRFQALLHQIRPDCVIASMERANFIALLSAKKFNIPVIVTEHGVPFVDDNKSKVDLFLRKKLYPRASKVVVLTEEIAKFYRENLKVPTVVIPNPVLADHVPSLALKEKRGGDTVELVAVGRLEKVKGFDLLVTAMKNVVDNTSKVKLTIWGDGPQRGALLALRSALNLDAFIDLPGRTEDVFSKLVQSDVFVMSSRHEAFPNALLEAQACGLPIVTFACPSGPKVIVRHEIDGLQVTPENPQALADGILDLIENPKKRVSMGLRAKEVFDRFGLPVIDQEWQKIISEVC